MLNSMEYSRKVIRHIEETNNRLHGEWEHFPLYEGLVYASLFVQTDDSDPRYRRSFAASLMRAADETSEEITVSLPEFAYIYGRLVERFFPSSAQPARKGPASTTH
jgi:hypothetical protein